MWLSAAPLHNDEVVTLLDVLHKSMLDDGKDQDEIGSYLDAGDLAFLLVL
jgi:hypothetical protein